MKTKVPVAAALAGTLLATCLVSGPAQATSVPVLKSESTPGIVTLLGKKAAVAAATANTTPTKTANAITMTIAPVMAGMARPSFLTVVGADGCIATLKPQAPPIGGTATTSASATTEVAGTGGAEAVRRQNGESLTRLPGLLIHLDSGSGMEAA
jgi:pyruvate/2-oxoacid:ferredoxin oxidoreductase beta subunit